MEEEPKTMSTEQEPKIEPIQPPPKRFKKPRLKAISIAVLAIILIAGAAAAAYYWRDYTAKDFEKQQAAKIKSLEDTKAALEKRLAESKTTTITPSTCVVVAPDATALANIKASITSGNTAALEGYMAPTVNVILAASEGLGPKTPTQAISQISSFISTDITSWDYNFALPAATLTAYRAGFYTQYFPSDAVVGKATNNKVISFSFDCNSKISAVFLATDAGLLE